MATPETVTPKASKAPTEEYDSLIAGLSPENRVAFRQAKLALVQAEAAFADSKRAAEDEKRKPANAFAAANDAYHAAAQKLKDDAVKQAQKVLTRLHQEAEQMKATHLDDRSRPDEGKTQVAKLQGTLDEYKARVAAIAAQMQLVDDAALALQKLSEPQEGKFNPGEARLNKMAKRIADEQNELAIAQAQIPLDAAMDAFDLKRAELEGSQPRRRMQ